MQATKYDYDHCGFEAIFHNSYMVATLPLYLLTVLGVDSKLGYRASGDYAR